MEKQNTPTTLTDKTKEKKQFDHAAAEHHGEHFTNEPYLIVFQHRPVTLWWQWLLLR